MIKNALFIVDSYNWALSNRAENLKKTYKNLNILIRLFKDLKDVDFNNFDLVYSLNWPIHSFIKNKISPNRKYRLVTTISSHVGRGDAKSLAPTLNQYDAISTSNVLLFEEFKKEYKEKVTYTPFGVNIKDFYKNTDPSKLSNVFGWVGNYDRPVKRFPVIKDVFEKLGNDYILKIASHNDGLNQKQMLDFYNSIGTLICFSESEGTPNPVLEAAACGRAIISTKVGNVIELDKTNAVKIVKTKDDLLRSIKYCKDNPTMVLKQGDILRDKIIEDWSWDRKSLGFKKLLGV